MLIGGSAAATPGTGDARVTRGARWIDRHAQDARASSQAATCARAGSRGRLRPVRPCLSVLLVGRYGRSMRMSDTIAITPATRRCALRVSEYVSAVGISWPCKPRTPQADAAGVWSRAQVLRSRADVCLLIPARARVCTHAYTRRIKPFGTRRCAPRARVRVKRLTSRAISLRPLRALTPVHGRDWHGLACGKCDAFKYTSPASSEPRRVRCVQRGPLQRWRRSRIESRAPSCERRVRHSRKRT